MQEATLKMFKGPRWVLKSSHCSLLLASCGKVRVVWKRKSLHASIGKLGRSLQRPKITCEGCDGGVFRGQSYYEQCIGWHVREMWHALWSKGIVNRIQNWDIVVRSTRVVSHLFELDCYISTSSNSRIKNFFWQKEQLKILIKTWVCSIESTKP